MKTAFTIWSGRIAPVFDVAGHAVLVTSENGMQLSETDLKLTGNSVMKKISCLTDAGVDTLVCGAVSRQALIMLQAGNITVYPFIAGTTHEVIQGWLKDRFASSDFVMPGCGQRRRCRKRRFGHVRSGTSKMNDSF